MYRRYTYLGRILPGGSGKKRLHRHHYRRNQTYSGRPCRPDQGKTLLVLQTNERINVSCVWSLYNQSCLHIIQRLCWALVAFLHLQHAQQTNIFDPKRCLEPPKRACAHLLVAYRDLKWSQSMVKLHSVMSIYNVETMLGSRFIFNNGNTHNGLIFDPNGVLRAPKTSTVTPIDGLS